MLRSCRMLIKKNKFLNLLFYRFLFWLANDVFKVKQRLIKKYGFEAMAKLMVISERNGIRCFPNYGTLLGLIREHGFIKHDLDIDFSLMPESCNLVDFYQDLERSGFYFDHFITIDGHLHEFTIRYHEFTIDIYQERYGANKSEFVCVTNKQQKGWPIIHYPAPVGFRKVIIKNVQLAIPNNATEMLDALYGNWHVVVEKWDDSMGPKVTMSQEEHEWKQFGGVCEWLDFLSKRVGK